MATLKLKRLQEQVVVVVGASSGIGREAAHQLARRGARVVVAARSAAGLESLVEEIRGAGGDAYAIVTDVTDPAQVHELANRTVERYGRIDTWVHVAGVALWGTVEQITPEEFRRVVDVNLMGQVYGAMAALPNLRREGGGALIHISSGEAQLPLPLQSAYAASKHGLIGFLDALRMELRHEGAPISVTNILPSGINTPIFDKARSKIGAWPRPLPPMYEPNVVVEAILYAAEHPVREIFAGGAAKAGAVARRLVPGVTDAVLTRVSPALQRRWEQKPEGMPDNLYEPLPHLDRVRGRFGSESRSFSAHTWLAMHPMLRRALAGVAAVAAVVGLQRALGCPPVDERRRAEGDRNSPASTHDRMTMAPM